MTHPAPFPLRDGDGGTPEGERAAHDAGLWAETLIRQFPELLTELAPGRGSLREEPRAPGPAERAFRAARAHAERQEALLNEQQHGLAVPGHSAAPVRLYVSDAIRDITDGVVELEEAVLDRLGLGRPRRAPVQRRLLNIRALLGRVAGDPVLADHVRNEMRRLARRCARALGETEAVVRVGGRCPWCDSVSLRAFPERRAVLCVNPACRCTDPACDCVSDPAFRHLWPENAWWELMRAGGPDAVEIAARMSEGDVPGAGPASGQAARRTGVRR
ncbi:MULTISPECIES: hypothetical protein [Streptomyces]|uniref:Uncharacterized protein n=1 Tax=Streptomyces cyaneofuscatus TaxID=66883 RepID=A0ABZ1EZY7_9ACTN|nr:hypothetical protein [Streptomyces cyaneofuscatus]WSB09716.1 hypothetical protein OG849_22020 [Streptomyces cyaneofuscatus]WSD46750.1 hypothetical protein OG857_13385 [Streptomyces cyaneofuscatus]